MTRVLACVAVLLTTSCTGLKARVMADLATDGLLAIEGYRGRTTERGLLREGVVVKDLTYARGWRVRAELVLPAEHAGELFVCDGSTITMWWPRFFFGLRIRGFEPPDDGALEDAVLEACRWTLERYELRGPGQGRVAGREVDVWTGVPLVRAPFVGTYTAWLDREHLVPLKVEAHDPRYAMTFDALSFGPQPDDAFRFEFPEGALVYEWDLRAPGVTLEEAQRRTEFPVLVPRWLPEGHAVERVVLSATDDPVMVALLMPDGGRWLSLSEMPNFGPILVPPIGIPVRIGEREGVLNVAFGFTTLSWSVGTTALTLIGNLPIPELLEVAASVGAP
jgi:hypothetical protein